MFITSFRTVTIPTVLGQADGGLYDNLADPGVPVPNVLIFDGQNADVDVVLHLDADMAGDGTFELQDVDTSVTLVAGGTVTMVNPYTQAKKLQVRASATKNVQVNVTGLNRHSGVQR